MAKLIFISPYLKGNRNSAQLANHVRYISTRDGVQTLNDGAKNLPPTKKAGGIHSKTHEKVFGGNTAARV